ncbi:hypothetical protein OAT67_00955 [Bacteriovoracaceae bacterium]|nr:hypothetical protein [Bacteriovoracaceae bacterium]|tara:strand:+ start:100172 stop:100657 length:486 start_codon:yes stop_codon:yes gene_type:complete
MRSFILTLTLLFNSALFASGSRATLESETKNQLIEVFKENEKLHAAFFNYDAKKINMIATSLNKKMKLVKKNEVSKLLKQAIVNAEKISKTSDRKKNNDYYADLSIALIYILNKYDLGREYNSYSCPMVKKKWVQNSKKKQKVHNPYAPEMPHCGRQDSRH